MAEQTPAQAAAHQARAEAHRERVQAKISGAGADEVKETEVRARVADAAAEAADRRA